MELEEELNEASPAGAGARYSAIVDCDAGGQGWSLSPLRYAES